jgi:hypothetical protein
MAFDRSKFKKTSLQAIETISKKAEATMPSSGGSNWVQFVTVEDGLNVFRVCPSETGMAYAPVKTSKLPVEVPVYDGQGNVTGKEVKDKNVFCADVHGTDVLGGKDPIASYIKYAYELADEIQDTDKKNKFLAPITGYNGKKGWVWGISPILGYVCYVNDNGEVKKLQLRPQWMKDMKTESIKASSKDTLSLDIFSDPTEGYPLCIEKTYEEDKKGKKKAKFIVYAASLQRGQSWEEFFEASALSDAFLEKLTKVPSLDEAYVNCYSRKDWDMALDGLQRFDEEQGYNIFQNDAFLDELQEMEALLPEEDKSSEDKEAKHQEEKTTRDTKAVPAQNITRPAAAAAASQVQKYPPLIKLKAFLEDYIRTEYEDTEKLPEDLPLVELRRWYDLAMEGRMLPFEEYKNDPDGLPFDETGENEDSPIDESKTTKGDDTLSAAKSRLANLTKNRRS